jgi:pyruvate/2-oxoglutarate dehydrogenase complex dihydrolipoamide acyltransferase (E2) component
MTGSMLTYRLHGTAAQEHNEVIAVIETDKVVLDVKASRSGVIEAVLVKVGEEVKEKQPIYRLRVESE